MKNINKLTKKRNNLKIMIIMMMAMLVILVSFSIASASMYDTLTALRGKNCNLTKRDSISAPIETALITKFRLTTTGARNCSFVVDYPPFHADTLNLLLFNYTNYAEIDYVIDNSKGYLFILGKNSSVLNIIANFTANYEKYQYYLKTYDDQYPYFSYGVSNFTIIPEYFWKYYDSTYTGPEDQRCVDDTVENIYLGNSGSYQDGGTVSFSSSCYNANKISYGFCFANYFMNNYYSCNCVNGKCIANPNDIFYYFVLYGDYAGPMARIIDSDLITSAVSSWINN